MLLSNNTLFFNVAPGYSTSLNPGASEKEQRETDRTLLAIEEFTHFMEGVKKDLHRVSKKLHNKETSRSAGFVATGLDEARQYLEIIKKVIEKTHRTIHKRSLKPETEALTPSPGIDGELKNPTLIETWKGLEIWQGMCENCRKDTRIASDGRRYLCVDCLKILKSHHQTDQVKGVHKGVKKKFFAANSILRSILARDRPKMKTDTTIHNPTLADKRNEQRSVRRERP